MSRYSLVTSQALSFSFAELKRWYNGYYTFDGSQLYNPWAIANALTDGILRSYWTESGNKFSRIVCSWLMTHSFARI